MIGDRTAEGWEIRLRVRDGARFFGAAFLLVWLCMWAAGEAFALWMLIRGGFALVTGTPPDVGREPLQAGPALMVGAFLLLWLSIWTLGGLAAGSELLRLLWGVDHISVDGRGLRVRWGRGPFRVGRRFERSDIHRVSLSNRFEYLVLELGPRRVELSRLGTQAERREAAATLNSALAISEPPSSGHGALPEQWEEFITPEGSRALVPNLKTRRQQARFTGVLAALAATVTFFVAREIPQNPGLIVSAVVALAITAALGWGADWLARGRNEWRLGSGRLTLCRRHGANVRELFEGRRLVLDFTTDSDGDRWHELYAVGDASLAEAVEPARSPVRRGTRPRNSRSIARLMNQPEVIRDLAAWLTRHTGIELEDRSTPEVQAMDLAQLRAMLAQSGPFGKLLSRLVDRLGDRARQG